MRLLIADELKEAMVEAGQNSGGGWGKNWKLTGEQIRDVIDNAPTVDAVAVVRCGECKYYDEKDHNCLDEMAYARCWIPTDFCSFGERREE